MSRFKNCWKQDLLPKFVSNKVPPLGVQDGRGETTKAFAKYFVAGWTWYMTECNPETGECFGKVFSPMCPNGELGYFSLEEFCRTKSNGVFPVERDIHFKPTFLNNCKNPCI